MTRYLQSTWEVFMRYRHLLQNMVQRDLKVKYRRSVLGFLWSLLNPILMMLIMTMVFSFMFRSEIKNFPVYMLSAQTMFAFFSESTTAAMGSILGGSALIKKIYIPKYIFPLEKVVFSLVNALFSMLALLGVILVTRVPLTPWFLLFPVPLLLLFFFNLGLGLILASGVVFFRDIQHLYSVVVLALNYLTPIFYPLTEDFLGATVLELLKLNPLYWYVAFFRQIVLYGQAPTAMMWAVCTICAAVMMAFGLLIIKKTQDRFILYI